MKVNLTVCCISCTTKTIMGSPRENKLHNQYVTGGKTPRSSLPLEARHTQSQVLCNCFFCFNLRRGLVRYCGCCFGMRFLFLFLQLVFMVAESRLRWGDFWDPFMSSLRPTLVTSRTDSPWKCLVVCVSRVVCSAHDLNFAPYFIYFKRTWQLLLGKQLNPTSTWVTLLMTSFLCIPVLFF